MEIRILTALVNWELNSLLVVCDSGELVRVNDLLRILKWYTLDIPKYKDWRTVVGEE